MLAPAHWKLISRNTTTSPPVLSSSSIFVLLRRFKHFIISVSFYIFTIVKA